MSFERYFQQEVPPSLWGSRDVLKRFYDHGRRDSNEAWHDRWQRLREWLDGWMCDDVLERIRGDVRKKMEELLS